MFTSKLPLFQVSRRPNIYFARLRKQDKIISTSQINYNINTYMSNNIVLSALTERIGSSFPIIELSAYQDGIFYTN